MTELPTRTSGRAFRLGILVNPIAGMGGKVGLRGTDGRAAYEESLRRGARALASERARLALSRIFGGGAEFDVVTAAGELGEALVRKLRPGPPRVVGQAARAVTTAADTRDAAAAMLQESVDLILFAGGDGTARDIFDAVGDRVPMLGIPAGVKMQSAVFATGPENAGRAVLAAAKADRSAVAYGKAEIMDLDEELLRRGVVQPRLYGYATTLSAPRLIQHPKAGSRADPDASLAAACREAAEALEPGCIYLVGPGTTTQQFMRALGLEGTLLGVDAVCDGRLLDVDLTEAGILSLIAGRSARIVVGVVGGQGCLFGRGNQQISSAVIERVGRDRIQVLAGLDKLMALGTRGLFVDTGDSRVDALLAGYIPVSTGPDQALMCRVSA